MSIHYVVDDKNINTESFLSLVKDVWDKDFDPSLTEKALKKTVNITAYHNEKLIACCRLLTDGYFFSTISEILVMESYQGQGIGKVLMDLTYQHSPSSLFFGAQKEAEGFYDKIGFERTLQGFAKKKDRINNL